VTTGGKREDAPEEDAVTVLGARPIHERRSWWWQGGENDGNARLQVQLQSFVSLLLRLRGNVRIRIYM
jgi:hypothetical protein